jgi:hypothetical protein
MVTPSINSRCTVKGRLTLANPMDSINAGTGLLGVHNSGVAGLVVGGSHILAHIPSMPAMDRRGMIIPDFGSAIVSLLIFCSSSKPEK